MATNFRVKISEIGLFTSFVALAFRTDWNIAMAMGALTAAMIWLHRVKGENLLNFGPVTLKFTRVVRRSTLHVDHF